MEGVASEKGDGQRPAAVCELRAAEPGGPRPSHAPYVALGSVRPSGDAGWSFRKVGITRQLVRVSVPFGKDFVDLKDTANLWSI